MTLTDTPTPPDPEVVSGDDDQVETDWLPGRVTSLVVLLLGAIGLLAAATLTIERFEMLKDPGYRPSCSINPVLSCGSVMVTEQASFFGFPNPLIGIAAYSVVIVVGVLALSGVPMPTWFWGGLTVGSALGMVGVGYLITQSIYRINALCPYCMVVWTITPILLVLSARITARLSGNVAAQRFTEWLWPALIVFYTVVILLIANHFWYYWSTLL
ncbi:vitamin K epoxide reductase family protein [Williamsia sp. CHRR-6]|uniref:vitamin K epoxide reductase family protein n=1 Tax=Williamsia sp. CHRR-6 TaxID=2835871 RepID=UPI001BD9CA4B|nr:vitamin K epoxide reductase family protein [Williamsia sp. CHRR-6]MBT0567239.1 vitamin K epoxide reductase family protein [Williamsia sp. CHRR-6]